MKKLHVCPPLYSAGLYNITLWLLYPMRQNGLLADLSTLGTCIYSSRLELLLLSSATNSTIHVIPFLEHVFHKTQTPRTKHNRTKNNTKTECSKVLPRIPRRLQARLPWISQTATPQITYRCPGVSAYSGANSRHSCRNRRQYRSVF